MGKLLTIQEVGEQLKLAPQTIYRKRSEGADIPAAIKIGGRVRWRQESVDAWLLAHEGTVAA
jgi:excisionase family DNA binding protein